MSVEAISAVDADLARVSAAELQLASALAQEKSGPNADPSTVQSGHAAVQAAEATLAQAEAALHADQAASASSVVPNSTNATISTAAPTQAAGHFVTDPGGIVA